MFWRSWNNNRQQQGHEGTRRLDSEQGVGTLCVHIITLLANEHSSNKHFGSTHARGNKLAGHYDRCLDSLSAQHSREKKAGFVSRLWWLCELASLDCSLLLSWHMLMMMIAVDVTSHE